MSGGKRQVLGGLVAVAATLVLFDLILATRAPLDVPYLRELYFVGQLTHREALSSAFLMRPTLEHVMPLPMALSALTIRASGVIGINRILNVVLLAAAAASTLHCARQLRGQLHPRDITVLLLAVGPAQVFSFISGFNLQLVLSSTLFVMAVCSSIVLRTMPARGALGMGVCAVVGLPLCGVNGILVAPFALVSLAHALLGARAKLGRLSWGVALGAGLVSTIACGALFPWSAVIRHEAPAVSPAGLALAFVASSLGQAGAELGPWAAFGVIVLSVSACASVLSSREARSAAGWAALLGIFAELLLGIAVAAERSRYPLAMSFVERYVALAFPLLCFAYVALVASERVRPSAVLLQRGVCAVVVVAGLWNTSAAWRRASSFATSMAAFVSEARSGATIRQLLDDHASFVYPFERETPSHALTTLAIDRRPPFESSPNAGWLSLESAEGPCAGGPDWVVVRASDVEREAGSDWHRAEAVADGLSSTSWRAPGAAFLEIRRRHTAPLSRVCLLSGADDSVPSRYRVEAHLGEQLVASAVADARAPSSWLTFSVEAPEVDRVRVHVIPAPDRASSIVEARLGR